MVGEQSCCNVVLGLHLGRDGYKHRAVRDHLREGDINWNLPFSSNIKKERSSLLYADAVYRRKREGSKTQHGPMCFSKRVTCEVFLGEVNKQAMEHTNTLPSPPHTPSPNNQQTTDNAESAVAAPSQTTDRSPNAS